MNGEFRIGPWLVQPSLNIIFQNGTAVHLEPKVMEVLVRLAERAGDPVPKEELIQEVWPDTFVTDDVLKRCVSELRRVFEDDAREPRVIETIPKRGYRLVVPVEQVETGKLHARTASVEVVASGESKRPGLPRRSRTARTLIPVSAVFVLFVLSVNVAYQVGRRSAVSESPVFHRLTFERGIIYSARFAPDNQVIYDASWDNRPVRIFTAHVGILQPMPLELTSAHLLATSANGELALALNGHTGPFPFFLGSTLARSPIATGAPRPMLEDVRWADWDRNGQLAVVHHLNGRSRLEYPIGKVLCETAGWISHIRFSPQHDRIAFVDHPIWFDDRGSIAIVNLEGRKTTLSPGWGSALGLAWSTRGDEIWFTAAKSGERRNVYAVNLRGQKRVLLQVAGGATLQDVSGDGRVLLTIENERIGAMALTAAGERDLSWSDDSYPLAISPDAKQVLLDQQSEEAGPDYFVGLRALDGSPPVRLGEGWGGNFSPDGKWTATAIASSPESTFLLPVGTGQRKELKHPGIRTYSYLSWIVPDGRTVVFAGIEPGRSPRSYIQSLDGDPARPVTPEGVLGELPSPDGKHLVAQQPDQTRVIYDIKGAKIRALPENAKTLNPMEWSPDSRYLYMYTRTAPPCQIWQVEITSGREKLIRRLSPTDPAGILEMFEVHMTPDEKIFVYGYDRYLSELYIVDGIR